MFALCLHYLRECLVKCQNVCALFECVFHCLNVRVPLCLCCHGAFVDGSDANAFVFLRVCRDRCWTSAVGRRLKQPPLS